MADTPNEKPKDRGTDNLRPQSVPSSAAVLGGKAGLAPLPLAVAGGIFAVGVLCLLAYLIVRPSPVPCGNRPILIAFFSLGCACASSFLGGYAAFRGKTDIHPGVISLGGGAAVLVIVMIVGNQLWSKTCVDPVQVVWGSLSGLEKRPSIEDLVWAKDLRDVDLYNRSHDPVDGSYTFEWMVRFINRQMPVRFEFHHRYHQTIGVDPLKDPNSQPRPEVSLNFEDIYYYLMPDSPSPLDLEYYPAPDAPPAKIGRLFQRTNNGLQPIGLATNPPSLQAEFWDRWHPFELGVVYAADSPCSPTATILERDRLLDQLGSANLPDQIAAREYLVQQRGACLGLVASGLADPSSTLNRQRGPLLANLTAAIDAIAKEGVTVPAGLWAQAGTWQYNLAQYPKAVEYFSHVDAATFDKDPQLLYYAAYAETKIGEPEKAIDLFQRYEFKVPAAKTSATVRGSLGIAYFQLARKTEARSDLVKAISLYEQSASELQQSIELSKSKQLTSTIDIQLGLTRAAEDLAKTKLQLQ